MNKLPPAIILAGGFGTRLKHVISDVPKPMAPINGRPFLDFVLDYLIEQGIREVIMAVGYRHEQIINHYQNQYHNLKIQYLIEDKPLGTGGAILNAFTHANLENAFIVNGDTYFPVDLNLFEYIHRSLGRPISIALKQMKNFDRYGTVEWNPFNQITGFSEKQHRREGYINGGIYLINKSVFAQFEPGQSFSIEKEIFENLSLEINISGIPFPNFFIDIGIPEDYYHFVELAVGPTIKVLPDPAKTSTLFLDRDGVINRQIKNGYVLNWNQFEFLPGSLQAIEILNNYFKRILIVTNQQGVGKQLMTVQDLQTIHQQMLLEIQKHSGHIDKIYYCPDLHSESPANRKPNIGMALQAKNDFPDLDFNQAFLAGDSISDIQFGIRAGLIPIQIGNSSFFPQVPHFDNLLSFAQSVMEDKLF